MSLVLSQNTASSVKDLTGLHLKWTNTISQTLQDLDLFYLDTVSGAVSSNAVSTVATTYDVVGLVSGRTYTFWLVALDVDGTTYESAPFTPTFPYALPAPVISSSSGIDNGMVFNITNPTLTSGETLTGSPKLIFVFLRVSTGSDRLPFSISKPYGQSSYTLTSSDNNKISNDNLYKVSCYINPDSADAAHNSHSALSNTVTVHPSDLPAKPVVSTAGNDVNGTADGSWSISWTAPPDLNYWSQWNNSTIDVSIFIKGVGDASYPAPIVLHNPSSLTYAFGAMTEKQYQVQVQYTNDRGAGELSDVVTFFNYHRPDAVSNLISYTELYDNRINVEWKLPTNLRVQPQNIVTTVKKDGAFYSGPTLTSDLAISYAEILPDSAAGSTFEFTVYQTSKYANNTSIVLNGATATTSCVYYIYPKVVTNTSTVVRDRAITFNWSAPTTVDGNNHSANAAKIVLTAGAFSATYNGTGGTFTTPAGALTNGTNYTAKIYAVATTPLGTSIESQMGVTISNLIPSKIECGIDSSASWGAKFSFR